jgi:hypothetical protein
MADESTTTSGEATQSTTTDQHDGDDDEGDPIQDANKLLETLRKVRKEKKDLEKEVRPLRTYKQQTEDAAKTDQERRDERIAELEGLVSAAQAKERQYNLRDAISEALSAADFPAQPVVSVPKLIRLLDLDDSDWDGDQPKNVKSLLIKLSRAEPGLFAARRGPHRRGGDGPGAGQPDDAE